MHVDRDFDAASLGIQVVRGNFHKSALELGRSKLAYVPVYLLEWSGWSHWPMRPSFALHDHASPCSALLTPRSPCSAHFALGTRFALRTLLGALALSARFALRTRFSMRDRLLPEDPLSPCVPLLRPGDPRFAFGKHASP